MQPSSSSTVDTGAHQAVIPAAVAANQPPQQLELKRLRKCQQCKVPMSRGIPSDEADVCVHSLQEQTGVKDTLCCNCLVRVFGTKTYYYDEQGQRESTAVLWMYPMKGCPCKGTGATKLTGCAQCQARAESKRYRSKGLFSSAERDGCRRCHKPKSQHRFLRCPAS